MEKGCDDLFFVAVGSAAREGVDMTDMKDSDSAYSHDGQAVDGYITPTELEMETLRHVPDKLDWSVFLIAFVEMAERFSFYGSTTVFVNFISSPRASSTGAGGPNGQSGALGQGQQTSTGLTTLNQFWSYVTPLLGAYLADTYWGRFKTIAMSIAITLVGHILLVVCSLPPVLDNPKGSLGILSLAIVVMGLGTGGYKSNISPLIAEQQRSLKPFILETTQGEGVIVDPILTTSRIYMYFYFFINVGSLIGQITMTFAEKYVGFWLAYTLPTVVFLLCPFVLFFGRHRYKKLPPQGSVFAKSLRLWRFAARGRWTWNPMRTLKNLRDDSFWESAKPSQIPVDERPRWMTFDDKWVDEVRRGFKACTVFVWFPLYWLAYNQMINNLVSQAATMTLHGVPNDVINNLDPLVLIIFIPIFDLLIYPFLRRIGIDFTPIKKITFGFYTGAAAMIWAAVTQHYVYNTNPCGYHVGDEQCISSLNVWIQAGAYVLIAFSEIFASITGLEYAFTKAPKNMKSLVMAVFLFTSAVAAALGEAFTSLSTDPLLVWNYGVMAVLAGVGGALFHLSFRHLDAEEKALNRLEDGEFHGQ